jgi:hypothetical protein
MVQIAFSYFYALLSSRKMNEQEYSNATNWRKGGFSAKHFNRETQEWEDGWRHSNVEYYLRGKLRGSVLGYFQVARTLRIKADYYPDKTSQKTLQQQIENADEFYAEIEELKRQV